MILLPPAAATDAPGKRQASPAALAMQAEFMRFGFSMDESLYGRISELDDKTAVELYDEIVPLLARMALGDRQWLPMYPNFPRQVMEASDCELFLNAITHYWTWGEWRPEYSKETRLPKFEETKFRPLSAGDDADLMRVFTQLLGSKASISDHDRSILRWFVENYGLELRDHLPASIPFKEQLCFFAAACLNTGIGELASDCCKTATDVLRVYVGLSGGDVSLAVPTKFRSLPRPQRRLLIQMLDRVANTDDLARHLERWKRAFHSLHVGEFKKTAPHIYELAQQVRDGKIRTFSGEVEMAIVARDAEKLAKLLGSRPGQFARRLDHLLRIFPGARADSLIELFLERAPEVPSRLLLQLLAHFRTRTRESHERIVFPKGSVAKARVLLDILPALPKAQVERLCSGIEQCLIDHYASGEPLGKVWVDPFLQHCPAPLSLRSAAEGLVTVARGTRLPLTDKSTLRMFVWWIGQDVDLSCTLYSEKLRELGHISYTNLRMKGIDACHSGDITTAPAPDGAAEFIDIPIEAALKKKIRYVAMNALDFTGVTFANIEHCHVGWMTRDHPQANEVYDPKTVEQKIDLKTPTRLAMPAVFDLKRREAIWLDLAGGVKSRRPNNVESNAATLVDLVRSGLSIEDKPSLHELFTLHARARGELVDTREEADTVFAFDDGITPFHTAEILAEYL